MKDFVKTKRLILSRYIVDDGVSMNDEYLETHLKSIKSSPEKLSSLIKENADRYHGILGWWSDISSSYSAKRHILEDNRLWVHEQQLQYYVYEKDKNKCIGIICALCDKKEASVLGWLSKEVEGSHYASEIQKAMDYELFVEMGMHCIRRECSKKNPNFNRVVSFMTHAGGYSVQSDNSASTVWQKNKEMYFQENPYLLASQEVSRVKSQSPILSSILSFLTRQKSKNMGQV